MPVPQIAMPPGDALSFAVDKQGPFNVGHRTREVTYTPPGGTGPRTINVDLWYPSLDAEGEGAKYIGIFSDPDVFELERDREGPHGRIMKVNLNRGQARP